MTTAIYIRDTENAQSADEQREVALDYATQVLNLDSSEVIVLGDTALRARTSPSSDDQRLFDLAEGGDIERVIVPDASRIAKNMSDLHERLTRLVEAGVAVHIVEAGLRIGEPGADAGPDDRTMLRALGIAAEVSAAVSSERTKEGIAAAKSAGKHIGRPPFGFDSDGNGGLVPNEDFETARTVIERIETGESKRSTARWAGITRATVRNIVDRKELYQSE